MSDTTFLRDQSRHLIANARALAVEIGETRQRSVAAVTKAHEVLRLCHEAAHTRLPRCPPGGPEEQLRAGTSNARI